MRVIEERREDMSELGHEIVDVYADEVEKLQIVLESLTRKYANQQFTTATREQFEKEGVGKLAEIGFVAAITWQEPDVPEGLDPIEAIAWENRVQKDGPSMVVPKIDLVGRVEKLGQFDHDRQQHGIVRGKMDGVAGYVDPNTGKLREDSKSKTIYG